MPLQNMTAIQTVTVGSGGASSITFSNIPQTYTDLVIKVSARDASSINGSSFFTIGFNSVTANYSRRNLYRADNGSVLSENASSESAWSYILLDGGSATANTFGSAEIYIPNYTSSNAKSASVDLATENNSTSSSLGFWALLNSSTAAITSITLTGQNFNFAQYSSATLYGVMNTVAAGAKAYGGYVTSDSTYIYHTFLASGTFTPTQSISADVLLIAGGGGGGGAPSNARGGGGGGAGGYRLLTSQSLTATNYTVTIGGGGTGGAGGTGTTNATTGTSGSNSVFGSLTATGGGYGGRAGDGNAVAGASGGSGGGGGNYLSAPSYGNGNAGSYSPVEGYRGGNASDSYPAGGSGGGGGGSASVGSDGVNSGNARVSGGSGTSNSWLGTAVTYAAGGAGGGSGVVTGRNGVSGDANTGTGGGGGDGGNNNGQAGGTGGSGGSGIVIVRYAK